MAGRVFARLSGGRIIELIRERNDIAREFHPAFIAQLVEVTDVKPEPKIGWVHGADGKFAPPPPFQPSPPQQMRAALLAGVAVVSTVTPGLSATYDAAGPGWQAMREAALYAFMFGAFAGGLKELDWTALSGPVTFAKPADLLAVTRAIADRLAQWRRFAEGKGAAPAGPISLDR